MATPRTYPDSSLGYGDGLLLHSHPHPPSPRTYPDSSLGYGDGLLLHSHHHPPLEPTLTPALVMEMVCCSIATPPPHSPRTYPDSSLGYGDRLLLHGLVDGHLVLELHLVELVRVLVHSHPPPLEPTLTPALVMEMVCCSIATPPLTWLWRWSAAP